MARKTQDERDRTNALIHMEGATNRGARLEILGRWAAGSGGALPGWLLEAYGRAEYLRGFMDGAAGATD